MNHHLVALRSHLGWAKKAAQGNHKTSTQALVALLLRFQKRPVSWLFGLQLRTNNQNRPSADADHRLSSNVQFHGVDCVGNRIEIASSRAHRCVVHDKRVRCIHLRFAVQGVPVAVFESGVRNHQNQSWR